MPRLRASNDRAVLQGYDVIGVHMMNWDQSDERGQAACPSTDDAKSAAEVCHHLDVPLTKVALDHVFHKLFARL